MPSPIGHLLAGAAIGLVTDSVSAGQPAFSGRARWTGFTLACALAAAVADLDLVYSPIHRRMTHSVGAAILFMIIAAGVTGWVTRRRVWRTALILGAAYLSHVAMDWMGTDFNPPRGIQALWPWSDAWFISGWDIFPRTERRAIFSAATLMTNVRAGVIEAAIMSPIVAAAWWMRRVWS